jgi:hypothetical protein
METNDFEKRGIKFYPGDGYNFYRMELEQVANVSKRVKFPETV